MNFVEKIITATRITMKTPRPYGALHLTFFICGLLFSLFAAKRLQNANEKTNRRLIFGIGLFLTVAEIYKQLYFYIVIGNGSYIWEVLPFQPCSIAMYLCLALPFIKNKKITGLFYNYLTFYVGFGGIVTYLVPVSVLTEHLPVNLHTLLWHMLLIFLSVYLILSGKINFSKNTYISATKLYLVLCGIAFLINYTVTKSTNQYISMFFIGPQVPDIVILNTIGARFGAAAASLLSVFAVCFGTYLFYRIVLYQSRQNHTRF